MRTARALLGAAAVGAVLFLGAEATVRRVAPTPRPSCYDEPRNPFFLRAWPEYTAPRPPRPPGEERVVVITNSQGYLRERADGHEAWPAQLELLLRESGRDAQVLNWAVAGASGAEMAVLAARAVEHRPELVLLVSYNENFGPFWRRKELSFARSDVPELAYHGAVRRRLPGSFLRSVDAYEPLGFLEAHLALLDLRSRLFEWQDRWTFDPVEPKRPVEKKLELHVQQNFALLNDFLYPLARARPRPRVLLVAMPLNPEGFEDLAPAAAFAAACRSWAERADWISARDATHLFPADVYYGPRHFRPEAHRAFAEWLLPDVERLLDER